MCRRPATAPRVGGLGGFLRARRGSLLFVYGTLYLLVFTGMLGLIDLGHLVARRQELLQVATLAAQAGASTFDQAAWLASDGAAITLDPAVARATALAVADEQLQQIGSGSVVAVDVDARRVVVTVEAVEPSLLNRALGGTWVIEVTQRAAIGLTE